MITSAYKGVGWLKKGQKLAHVINEWSLRPMPDRPLMGLVSNSGSGMPTFPLAHTSEVDLEGMLSNSAETLEAATLASTTTKSSLSSSCFESNEKRLFSSGQMTTAANSREISVAAAAQIGQHQQHRLIQNGAGNSFKESIIMQFIFR